MEQKRDIIANHTNLSVHQHHSFEEHRALVRAAHNATIRLAVSATLHCLLGCGIGEVVGMVIGTYLGWTMIPTMILAIALGFVFGFGLGIIPLLRKGFGIKEAFKIVFVAEFLSIAVMEAFEVGTQILIPGVLESGLTDVVFWFGMAAALLAGFLAALPVNYYMIKRGIQHQH